MNTNKFFEAFTELDNDLIENALPQTNEPEIARSAERIRLWKPFTAAAALVVLACGITVAGMKLHSLRSRTPADSVSDDGSLAASNAANSNVNYSYINIDEQVYFSARELVNKSDIAVTGKVTDISFELHDMHTGDLLTEYSEDAWLCTVYDIDVITSYKGDKKKNVKIITYNGLEDYRVSEQAELMGTAAERGIPVLEKPDDINPGSEYLFLLSQPDYDKSGMLHLINHSQGVFRTDKPTVKERYSQASLNDIVDCLTNANNHSEEVSVIHNDQHVSLSVQQYTALTDAVMQAVTTECLPDVQLQMKLSEQHIKEYRQNGYVIAIQYDDFNAPTYAYGDSSDKKARGICHITVLIGEEGEPSYITYSYIVSPLSENSEQQYGGTYYLSDSSRNSILQILDINSGNSDNAISIGINSDVMWGMGKTIDEITERYGDVTAKYNNVYTFKNGYGKYVWDDDGSCKTIGEITAKDFLIGDLSTLDLDNFASKCGFEVVPLNSNDDPNTMYEGYRFACYTHPSYKNITFSMCYKESGFDEEATFRISYDSGHNNEHESEHDNNTHETEHHN